jgi:hypothetical protein
MTCEHVTCWLGESHVTRVPYFFASNYRCAGSVESWDNRYGVLKEFTKFIWTNASVSETI